MPPLPGQALQKLFRTESDLGDPMAISHELSSDIATAILSTEERTPGELNDLKKIVLQVHSILQQMTAEARAAREKQRFAYERSNDH